MSVSWRGAASAEASGPWLAGPQNVSGTSASIGGLEPETLYQVQVRASKAEGDSGYSSPGGGRTSTIGNRAPSFSRSSATRQLPENSLDARWEPPATPGRPHVTSYDVRFRESGGTSWRNGPQNRPAAIAEITGLEARADYEVQVRATSAEGDSGWSQSGLGSTHALAARVA